MTAPRHRKPRTPWLHRPHPYAGAALTALILTVAAVLSHPTDLDGTSGDATMSAGEGVFPPVAVPVAVPALPDVAPRPVVALPAAVVPHAPRMVTARLVADTHTVTPPASHLLASHPLVAHPLVAHPTAKPAVREGHADQPPAAHTPHPTGKPTHKPRRRAGCANPATSAPTAVKEAP